VALLLRKQGIRRIRPLQGGLDAWRKLGYPVENGVAETSTPA
jgi:3-mercaptopyruvate sulfurtransferase SseA